MTQTLTSEPPAGKRERLVEGARRVIYEQGVERTTIADIAAAADVPIGNVYYYFKTKNDLVEAAITANATAVREMLAAAERHHTPRGRLNALIRAFGEQREHAAWRGCPMGTLCSELDKRDDDLTRQARDALALPIDWAEQQFIALGRSDARELAVALIASYEGISLIANTFHDPSLVSSETRRLERWIDSLT
jgi:TetR/AcrR family transcriptional regulator, transcriptional repressor for nem operon